MSSLFLLLVFMIVRSKSSSNIILTVSYVANEPTNLVLFIDDINLSCGGMISDVEITHNEIWKSFDIFDEPNAYIFNAYVTQTTFTSPLSVRITKTLHSVDDIINLQDIINLSNSYDTGTNFCQESNAKPPILEARNNPISSPIAPVTTISNTTKEDHEHAQHNHVGHIIKHLTSSVHGILILIGVGVALSAFVVCMIVLVCLVAKGKICRDRLSRSTIGGKSDRVCSFSTNIPVTELTVDDRGSIDDDNDEEKQYYTIKNDKTRLMAQRSAFVHEFGKISNIDNWLNEK